MNKNLSKIANITLPLLLGVSLVFYAYTQFTDQQLKEILSNFKHANYFYILLASLFTLLSLWARSYRWKFVLSHMGYTSSTSTNFMAICIGYLLNLTVPRSGEVSRALVLQKYNSVPFDKAFGSIIAERIIDLVCLLLCVSVTLLLQFDILKSFLGKYISYEQIYLLIGALFFIIALLWFLFFWIENKIITFIKKKISGLIEGVSSVLLMPNKLAFILLTCIIWIGYIATFYCATYALEQTSSLSIGAVMAAFVAGSFAISFTNGGIGAFPLIITEILRFYSIDAVDAASFGWIIWSTQTAIVVILGALSFLLLPLVYTKK
ncbi:lysylphosphatidylglycerol synthase transmembrane domain-containing protein [Myroides sp. LJL116]